jgi:hypothetical protein
MFARLPFIAVLSFYVHVCVFLSLKAGYLCSPTPTPSFFLTASRFFALSWIMYVFFFFFFNFVTHTSFKKVKKTQISPSPSPFFFR